MEKDVSEKLLEFEIFINQLESRLDAYELVIAWLLKHHEKDGALSFLRSQSEEFERHEPQDHQALIDAIDQLRAHVVALPS